jgi:hypothetical protein
VSRFRYPAKVAPGQYDVVIWGSDEPLRIRFKTERDAMRFFLASQRGEAVPATSTASVKGEA